MKEYDKAFADYQRAYAMDSTKIEALVGLSQVHLARQEFEPALKFVTRSLEIKPSYEAHFTRAVVLKALGRFDEAVKEYEEALAMNDNVSARHNLANIYLVNLKNYPLAAREYGQIAEAQPSYPHIFTYKGLALYQAGRYNDAIAALNSALSTDRVDAQAYGYRALSYHKIGDDPNAQKDAATAADLGFVFDAGAFN
jgi:tetratricopeptide (TPR) repeat protein